MSSRFDITKRNEIKVTAVRMSNALALLRVWLEAPVLTNPLHQCPVPRPVSNHDAKVYVFGGASLRQAIYDLEQHHSASRPSHHPLKLQRLCRARDCGKQPVRTCVQMSLKFNQGTAPGRSAQSRYCARPPLLRGRHRSTTAA